MRWLTLVALMAVPCAIAATIEPPSEYPIDRDEAVARFQFAMRSLKAQPTRFDQAQVRATDHIGQVLEVHGALAGRVAVNSDDPEKRSALVRLELTSGVSLCASSSSELKGLQDGDRVRAIIDVPSGDPRDAKFRLRAVVREADLIEACSEAAPARTPATTAGLRKAPATRATRARPTPAAVAAPQADMALPPEFRNQGPQLPSLVPLPTTVTGGLPRPGKEGAWDPVGNIGVPIIDQGKLDAWKRWIRRRNSHRDDREADWIARWVIYYSAINGVDHRLMFAMIECESSFDPFCLSSAGAAGLTQLMPCNVEDFRVVNKWNVQDNIRAGVAHFKEMLDMWAGRGNYEQFALAAASYNAGPNRVKRAGGIPDITETRNYVRKLGNLFYQLYQDGFP